MGVDEPTTPRGETLKTPVVPEPDGRYSITDPEDTPTVIRQPPKPRE